MIITLVGQDFIVEDEEFFPEMKQQEEQYRPLWLAVQEQIAALLPGSRFTYEKVSLSTISLGNRNWVKGTIQTSDKPIPSEEIIAAIMSMPYVERVIVAANWDAAERDYTYRKIYGKEKQ